MTSQTRNPSGLIYCKPPPKRQDLAEDWQDEFCSAGEPSRVVRWAPSSRSVLAESRRHSCMELVALFSRWSGQQATCPVIQENLDQLENRLREAENTIANLADRVAELEEQSESQIVHIISFAPKPYVVQREVPVLVEPVVSDEPEDNEYVARFVEANVGSTGSTLEEAIRNVKDRMISKFEALDAMPSGKLGKAPARQLAVLRSVMKRAD